MSETALNGVAIAVFLMTLSVLLGPIIHLSPLVPALTTLAFLGLVTLDQLAVQGQGLTIFLDLFTPAEQKERLLYHEAGHFLVAYCLDIPVVAYNLSAREVWQAGQVGRAGVQFEVPVWAEAAPPGRDLPQNWQRWATVWLAGIAAEQLIYGNVQGGNGDRQQLRQGFAQAGLSPHLWPQKESWALLQARHILTLEASAHEQLKLALAQRRSVEDCYALLSEIIKSPTAQSSPHPSN
jgi:hypothetical protein